MLRMLMGEELEKDNSVADTGIFELKNSSNVFENNGNITEHVKTYKSNGNELMKTLTVHVHKYESPFLDENIEDLFEIVEENPLKCQFCEKIFASKSNLDVHVRVHAGKEPFRCEQCDENVSNFADYKRHVRLHVGDKPYKCNYCGRQFQNQKSLRGHVQIHENEGSHNCSCCKTFFARKKYLIKCFRSIMKNEG